MVPQATADTVIATQNLRLRRPNREDVGSIAALASDWEVAKQTGQIPHPLYCDRRRAMASIGDRRCR